MELPQLHPSNHFRSTLQLQLSRLVAHLENNDWSMSKLLPILILQEYNQTELDQCSFSGLTNEPWQISILSVPQVQEHHRQ